MGGTHKKQGITYLIVHNNLTKTHFNTVKHKTTHLGTRTAGYTDSIKETLATNTKKG